MCVCTSVNMSQGYKWLSSMLHASWRQTQNTCGRSRRVRDDLSYDVSFMSQACQCHHHVPMVSCSAISNTVYRAKARSWERTFRHEGLQRPIFMYIDQTSSYSPHHHRPIRIYMYTKDDPTRAHPHGLLLPCCFTRPRARCDTVCTRLTLKPSCNEQSAMLSS